MSGYATKSKPEGKYKLGTRIRISGHPTGVENGLFEITVLFLDQNRSDGDQYFQCRRIKRDGQTSTSNLPRNHRGG